ncbi:unnamed protein product [Meganyctiphanes norvegica]|uniref:Uncharacterized protein n=1 Tax=Meganyctiphanes norvegica TaxID=48144 RepID=A0AAV2RGB9_MEGNR
MSAVAEEDRVTMDAALVSAVTAGDQASLARLLAANVDASVVLPKYPLDTPSYLCDVNLICIAAMEGQAEVIASLQEAGAYVNHRTGLGYNAIHIAAQHGHQQALHELVTLGVDVDTSSTYGWTALHYAASHGHPHCVEQLLELDAKLDAWTRTKWTPLMCAAERDQVECVEVLVSAGADVSATDMNGLTAINIAFLGDRRKVMSWLQGNIHLPCLQETLASAVAAKQGAVAAPLEIAVAKVEDRDAIAKALELAVAAGDQIALSEALKLAVVVGDRDMVCAALAVGADATVVLPKYRLDENVNLICVAAKEGRAEVIATLHAAGACLNHQTKNRSNPLFIAASSGHDNVLRELGLLGVYVDTTSPNGGYTALHWAANSGHHRCVKQLLIMDACVDAMDSTQRTPLMWAIGKDQVECVRILVSAGADTSKIDSLHHLHRAAEEGKFATLKYLIEAGQHPDAQDKDGRTPLDLAQLKGWRHMVDWLRKVDRPLGSQTPLPQDSLDLQNECRIEYEDSGKEFLGDVDFINPFSVPEYYDGHYQDENGWTVLHHLATKNEIESVEDALDYSMIAANVVAYDGSTPADVADKAGYHYLAQKLRQPRQKDYTTAVDMVQHLLDKYNTRLQMENRNNQEEHHSHLPNSILNLTNHIKKSFSENSKVDEQDLYYLLVHKISQEDNVEDVVKLVNLGCPVSPVEGVDVSALRLAIDLDRPRTLTALIAYGSDIFFRSSGYNILQYTWKTLDATKFAKMIINRMYDHRVRLEMKNTKSKSALESIAIELLELLKKHPEKIEINKELLMELNILEDNSLTSILCEAVDRKCPVLVSFIYAAGARAYTHSIEGKTAIHHTLDADTGMEEMLLTHLGCSLYVADKNGRMPIDLMPEKQKKRLKNKMLLMEFNRMNSLIYSARDNEKKNKYKQLIILFCCLYDAFEVTEKYIPWRELYLYILNILETTFPKYKETTSDDRLIWIGHLSEKIYHQFKNFTYEAEQEYEQESLHGLLYCLYHLKRNITRISMVDHKVHTKGGEVVVKTHNVNNYLMQAFEFACEKDLHVFLHILIAQVRVDPETTFDVLQTQALHHASAEGNGRTVAYLLHTCNVQKNVTDINGNNAAHYAYMNGKIETGNYLTKNKPELVEMKNSSGKTPLELLDAYKERMKQLLNDQLCEKEENEDLKENINDVYEKNNEYELATTLLNLCLLRKNIRGLTFENLAKEKLVNYNIGENRFLYGDVIRYLRQIGSFICKEKKYLQGKLVPAGSSADGCRLGAPDEFDFNWVLELDNIDVKVEIMQSKEQILKGYTNKIILDSSDQEKKSLLSGSNLQDTFFAAVEKAISKFPKFHDSRLSVVYPGVKKTGVGVALTFAWMGAEHKLLLIDVDLVPVIKTARPEGYPHPPLTAHLPEISLPFSILLPLLILLFGITTLFSVTESPWIISLLSAVTGSVFTISLLSVRSIVTVSLLTPTHSIDIAGEKWEFCSDDLDAAYVSRIDNCEGRFSQALEENYIFLNLGKHKKMIFLFCKYFVSVLKAEGWYPENLKKRYKYFDYRQYKLPTPQGFLLKSSFFRELERVPDDKYWTPSHYLNRTKSIFLHMCRKNEYKESLFKSLLQNKEIHIDTKQLDSGLVPPYFASGTEKQNAGYLAPTILMFLNQLNTNDFVSN